MRTELPTAIAVVIIACWCAPGSLHAATTSSPNIVIILSDDQGYADISLNPQHPREVSTPNMDALAKEGVSFTQGYTSGHVCSPTRAGLMLGRYQQRVGVYSAGDGGRGFDPELPIFPSFLPNDYTSAAIGKWHLGLDEDYPELKWHAMNRGFDECYKFMGRGGHDYFDLRSDSEGRFSHPIYRNKVRVNDEGYLTNRLTEEAVAFIDRNKSRPFFLYLAYNAVHAPPQAPEDDIDAYHKRFPKIGKEREVLMAMLKHLDDGVGDVVAKLKQEELFDNTLLFFLTDNGGSKAMRADNTPLRGFKGSLAEGGIRTPFLVSWPAKFPGQRTVDTPVISLDILPTALDAVGKLSAKNNFDGKTLLPLLTGDAQSHHDTLFWCKDGDEWAVRRGNWKLRSVKGQTELFNLTDDPSEQRDLVNDHSEIVTTLRHAFAAWKEQMADPITGSAKPAEVEPTKETLTVRGKERLNVLFIAIDDLNDWVGCLGGHPQAKTPNIDALAARGMLFTNAHCQAPICGPSRASLLSGQYPHSTGVYGQPDKKGLPADTLRFRGHLLPEYFADHGYETLAVGKITHGYRHEIAFQEYGGKLGGSGPKPGDKTVRFQFSPDLSIPFTGTQTDWAPFPDSDEEMPDHKAADWAIGQLGEQHDRPFFLAVGFVRPHVPFYVPQKWFDLFPLDEIQIPGIPDDDLNDVPEVARKLHELPRYPQLGWLRENDNNQLRRCVQAYLACTTFVDHQVGRVLKALASSPAADNTVIVLFSDHGYHLGEKHRVSKHSLWEESTRVPLIVCRPGESSGDRCAKPVGLIDLYPTLLSMCGLPVRDVNEGHSLVPLLDDPKSDWRFAAITTYGRMNHSLRSEQYRFIRYENGAEELYDHDVDPHEWTNLADDHDHQRTLHRFREALPRFDAVHHAATTTGPVNAWFEASLVRHRVGEDPEELPPVFDGESLDNWMLSNGKPITAGWEVVDRAIHRKRGKKRAGHIVTRHEYGDFDLSFEWKIAKGGNSGLKYRVRNYGRKTLGCEFQIMDDGRSTGTPGRGSTGSLYAIFEPDPERRINATGEFNTSRIIVRGDHIEHWLNGRLIVCATVGNPEWDKRVAASKFADASDFGRNRFGRIMLTDHGSEVWYRNFTIVRPCQE